MKYVYWIIFIPLVFTLGCSDDGAPLINKRTKDHADQESWGVTIVLTNQGIERVRVRSGHLEKYNKREFILLDE